MANASKGYAAPTIQAAARSGMPARLFGEKPACCKKRMVLTGRQTDGTSGMPVSGNAGGRKVAQTLRHYPYATCAVKTGSENSGKGRANPEPPHVPPGAPDSQNNGSSLFVQRTAQRMPAPYPMAAGVRDSFVGRARYGIGCNQGGFRVKCAT